MRTVSCTGLQVKRGGNGRRWEDDALLDDARADRSRDASHLLREAEEVQGVVGQLGLGDECPHTLTHGQIATAHQVSEGLAGGHAADADALGEITLGGKLAASG